MGQNRLSTRVMDGRDAFRGAGLPPLNALVFVRVQIAVEGLPEGGDIPAPEHHPGEVGAGDHSAAGEGLHLLQRHVQPLPAEKRGDAVFRSSRLARSLRQSSARAGHSGPRLRPSMCM